MVGAIKRWLGIEALERENAILARVVKEQKELLADTIRRAMSEDNIIRESLNGSVTMLRKEIPSLDDHEARIAYLENRLTAKQSEAKIVPKTQKTTFRQFAEAASKASEEME